MSVLISRLVPRIVSTYQAAITVLVIQGTGSQELQLVMVCTIKPVFLFDLILYVPSTIFQLNRDGSSWVEPVLSSDKCVLLKDHNAVTPVRLEPAASRSRVKHSIHF